MLSQSIVKISVGKKNVKMSVETLGGTEIYNKSHYISANCTTSAKNAVLWLFQQFIFEAEEAFIYAFNEDETVKKLFESETDFGGYRWTRFNMNADIQDIANMFDLLGFRLRDIRATATSAIYIIYKVR